MTAMQGWNGTDRTGRPAFGRYVVLAVLFQALAACGSVDEAAAPINNASADGGPAATNGIAAAPAPQGDARLILVFGDSLYAGYNLNADEGFAPALERALQKAGVAASVVNGGVSGDTTAAGLARLAFTLDGLPRKPDLVLVGLGGNDMLRGLSPAETRANLTAILDQLKARDIPAMLTGMVAAPNLGPDYAAAFNPIYGDLAKRYDVPLDPFFLDGAIGQPGMMLDDRLHPSADGVERIVGRVAPLVVKALPE